MTMYYIASAGSSELPPAHFTTYDPTIAKDVPSFQERIALTKDCLRATFIGNNFYDYLLDSGIEFYIVTHPWVTFSCQDKIHMYNHTRCNLDRKIGRGTPWRLTDTVKAIYFWHKKTHKYHIAVIPGQSAGTHINVAHSFRGTLKDIGYDEQTGVSEGNQIRIFPLDTLVFGFMQEGCFSPLPPKGSHESTSFEDMIDAIYFDSNHLISSEPNKLDDLSIAMRHIRLGEGEYIKKTFGLEDLNVVQQISDSKEPLNFQNEDRKQVAIVDGHVFGDYRDCISTGDNIVLKFTFVPNHMLSLLMNHRDLFELVKQHFPKKAKEVDMRYK